MSRKLSRRFIKYHPGLFQDRKLILLMAVKQDRIYFLHLPRILVRFRQTKNSSYLMLKFIKIQKQLDLDFNEILVLGRLYLYPL